MPQTSGYLRHFIACNRADLSGFVPFLIDGRRYGFVRKTLAAQLTGQSEVFDVTDEVVTLSPRFAGFAARSEALRQASRAIAESYGKNLRGEMYAIVENWGDDAVAQIDRAAIPWFGLRAWGVHVNGFVRKADGIHLWIGERSADRPAEPGKLDNMIGGGQPIGLTLEQNLCKEAMEEAGVAADLALTASFARILNYQMERPEGLRTDSLFIYDLELPQDFIPRNTDGEVAAFHLMPLPEVAALVRDGDRFKFNCNLVIIDFLMRHGFITARDGEYGELTRWLSASPV